MNELKLNKELWDIFTSKEEYNPFVRDRYKRFPYYLSKIKDIFDPEVSKFLINNNILKVKYPEDRNFAVCLTHDVDIIYLSNVKILYSILRNLKDSRLRECIKLLMSKLSKRSSPFWNFSSIMDLEEKYMAKSTFYFLALEKGDMDFNFSLKDIKDDLKEIVKKGWEVGLHGGHEAYNNLNKMEKEKKRLEEILEREVIGYRNHYLRFCVPDTWELLRKAGFKYDTSFGFDSCVGFRNGMCHPFKPFNLNSSKYIDILEIPVNIMDFTLNEYMCLDIDGAWKIIKFIVDIVESYKGVVTILWHNTYMIGSMRELYERILEYCYQKGAWMTSGEEIWRWWRENQFSGGA